MDKAYCSLCRFYTSRDMMNQNSTTGFCGAEPERFVTTEDWHSVRTERQLGDPKIKNADNKCPDYRGRQMDG